MIQGMISRGLKGLGVENISVSPRERGLLAGLAAAGAVFLAVAAFDWSEGMRANAAQVRSDRETFERQLARQAPGLAEQSLRRQVLKARKMAFSANTVPIARAAAQAQLERMANQANVLSPRVLPEGEPVGKGTLKTQIYTLQGKFDWPPFLALVEEIAQAPQSIAVLGVQVDAANVAPTFVLRVRVPLVMDGEG